MTEDRAISLNAVIKAVDKHTNDDGTLDDDISCILEDVPSAEPKTGHWIYDRTRNWDGECAYECSECGMGSDVEYAYCMRCGVKMIEPQERRE